MDDYFDLQPDTDEAFRFLQKMQPDGPWHVVAIPPDGKLHAASFKKDQEEELADWINEQQGEANIYFHVNELRSGLRNAKAKKGDVVEIIALHVDVDDLSARRRIEAYEPPPTAIVMSGGGY
ncbi:hypothetical protein [Methylopila sp. Yamaguchi]|uniref:hypothetical protein n=1 Tax=Methylopila sp. Yamaguchi TaxID=1437817 RepID=UPI000CAD002A|nr:hypothetical protein [Methylopila sp. Yamaguchi]GBD47032.1 hypothetical protein METY_0245 [Methylopila sp. Yamaguchi]